MSSHPYPHPSCLPSSPARYPVLDPLADLREAALKRRDFSGFLYLFPSHRRLEPFLALVPRLKGKEYWPLVRDVWISAEVTLPQRSLWLELFRARQPHREKLMSPQEHTLLAGLPDPVTIHRGCGQAVGAPGLSWTLDPAMAERFAHLACGPRRHLLAPAWRGEHPLVARATCPKSAVLAVFTERLESEVVVDPQALRDLTLRPAA